MGIASLMILILLAAVGVDARVLRLDEGDVRKRLGGGGGLERPTANVFEQLAEAFTIHRRTVSRARAGAERVSGARPGYETC